MRHGANAHLRQEAIMPEQFVFIQYLVDNLLRDNADERLRRALDEPDGLFVKNLENVQGDERDVIFISVGYGKDVHGYMAMRFGPLSNEGGERRLNVLISRAKKRCEVFASIVVDDIEVTQSRGGALRRLRSRIGVVPA